MKEVSYCTNTKIIDRYTTPNYYRPISLLSILSKVLEQHVHHIISNHLRIMHPLSNSQWGFQPGKSTVTALLTTVDKWLRMLDEGREIGAVFFNLRKAFDSVPHKVLMEKLQQTGLNINILAWIGNYLTSRKQMVVNGSSSSDSHVLSGVPQGSILGPLLFLIYIDDLTYLPTSNGSHSVLYADDLLLFRPLKGREDFQLLQDDISIIDKWVQQNHLTFNSAKCKYMVISRKRRPTYAGVLYLGDTPLEQVEMFQISWCDSC